MTKPKPNTIKTKRCAHCGVAYYAAPKDRGGGFYRDRSQADGLSRDCAPCVLNWRRIAAAREEAERVAELKEKAEAAQKAYAAALYALRRKLAKNRKGSKAVRA